MNRLMLLWRRIPEQIRRLFIPFFIIIIGYLFTRWVLVPPDFGLLGHYRASSITTNMQKEIRYAGAEACTECHDQIVATKNKDTTRGLPVKRATVPVRPTYRILKNFKPAVTRTRTLCLLCHEYLPTRPTGFPQVISDSHNPTKPCISCHRPHEPRPPKPLKKCEACHAKVQRVLTLSNHSNLDCTSCHETPAQHYTQPTAYPPKRMQNRQVCLRCHDKTTSGPQEIPRIDGATHGGKYLCWQCHYPHMPEAR